MIKKLNIEGYRSIRDLSLNLLPINVLTGPNGCGKSNLYNSLVLIARAAEGRLARAIAEEEGIILIDYTAVQACWNAKSRG